MIENSNMSLFINPEDYILYQHGSEIKEKVIHIGKRAYSMWSKKNKEDIINDITLLLDSTMQETSKKYRDLPYDYILTIAAMETINIVMEENIYIKENLSKLKMQATSKKDSTRGKEIVEVDNQISLFTKDIKDEDSLLAIKEAEIRKEFTQSLIKILKMINERFVD